MIAVGMPDYAGGAGRVRVFRYNGQFDMWISDSPLDGGVGDGFGTSLDFDSGGDFLIVGAPGAGPNGEVEVFAYVGATWLDWQTIEPPVDYDSQSNAAFGSSVAAAGNRLAIGAPNGNRIFSGIGFPAIDGGIVELFEFSFLAYTYSSQRFQAPVADDNLGASVGMELLDGGSYLLAAGSPARGTTRHGQVRTFWSNVENPLWTQGEILEPSDGASGDEFGTGVAVGDGVVASGAPGRDLCLGGPFCTIGVGAVYIYDLQGRLFDDGFESGDVTAWQ